MMVTTEQFAMIVISLLVLNGILMYKMYKQKIVLDMTLKIVLDQIQTMQVMNSNQKKIAVVLREHLIKADQELADRLKREIDE